MPSLLTIADFVRRVAPQPSGCWQWTGPRLPSGYGTFGRRNYAHRFAYETRHGAIPPGQEIDHLCRNRGCVNPAHLEPVTSRENQLRGNGFSGRNARKTHCKRGHALDRPDVVVRVPKGSVFPHRQCRVCMRAWKRAKKSGRTIEAELCRIPN